LHEPVVHARRYFRALLMKVVVEDVVVVEEAVE
jgi:hypothetical protein